MRKVGLWLCMMMFLHIAKGHAEPLDLQAQIDVAQEGSVIQLEKVCMKVILLLLNQLF